MQATNIRHIKQRGFTLIEIMVVVVILGILAAMIVPKIMSRPEQAKMVKAKQDIMAILCYLFHPVGNLRHLLSTLSAEMANRIIKLLVNMPTVLNGGNFQLNYFKV